MRRLPTRGAYASRSAACIEVSPASNAGHGCVALTSQRGGAARTSTDVWRHLHREPRRGLHNATAAPSAHQPCSAGTASARGRLTRDRGDAQRTRAWRDALPLLTPQTTASAPARTAPNRDAARKTEATPQPSACIRLGGTRGNGPRLALRPRRRRRPPAWLPQRRRRRSHSRGPGRRAKTAAGGHRISPGRKRSGVKR